MLTDEQKLLRKGKIGCSSIGAVLGVSKWSTPYQAWMKITGRDTTDFTSEAAHWGNRLEGVIVDEYAERNKVSVLRNTQTVTNSAYPWLISTPDAYVMAAVDEPTGGLEVKTVGIRGAAQWGEDNDDIPLHYLSQVYGYLAVCDWAPWWDVAVLIGGQKYQQYRIMRDNNLIGELMAKAGAWHEQYVVGDVAPPLTGADDAAELFPQSHTDRVVVTLDTLSAFKKLVDVRGKLEELEHQEAHLETQLKCAIGAADTLVDSTGSRLCTWKTQESNRFDQKRFETEHPQLAAQYRKKTTSRVFRICGE